ncbi:MAG: hypothetical protein AAB378_01325 [Patescibacteria group bacterium]
MRRVKFILFLSAVLVLAAFFQFYFSNIPETDSLYHFRHAEIYKNAGLLASAFPWVQYSVINVFSADIWYGFHLFLTPFTYFSDPVFGLRVAGMFMTAFLLLAFFWSLRRLKVTQNFFWPFLLFFSSPLVSYHLIMARPHVISLGSSVLLYSFLAVENLWGIFFVSLGISFFHLSLFWSALLITGTFFSVKFFTEKVLAWQTILASLAGLLTGWVLRPDFWGAAKIAYVQIVQLMLEKRAGTPLHFGMELYPLPWRDLGFFALFLALWLAAILVFVRALIRRNVGNPFQATVLWSSFILSAVFWLMTMFVAERSFDFFAAFGVVFMASAFTYLVRNKIKKFVAIFGAAVFVVMAVYGVYQTGKFLNTIGVDAQRFKSAMEWLKNNSEPGDVVFNVSWDYFPELFFWNTKNFYVSGMDPIFQYAYNPKMYWEAYYLETGKTAEFTCAATACAPEALEETHTALKRDFKAKYLFLDKYFDGRFYAYLATDRRFLLKYEDMRLPAGQAGLPADGHGAAIFEVL